MEKQTVVVKARAVYESYNVLLELASQKSSSASRALFMALNTKVVEKHYAEIEAKRIELIKRYGEELEDGNTMVLDENIGDFSQDFMELMDAELSLDLYMFEAYKLDTLFTDVTPEQMLKIEYMVTYGE